MTARQEQTAEQKALRLNLDHAIYGTLAEIGAGQETARHFFRVGGAAGTIAKTMSAYDMKFSDAIYGKSTRYVSRDRLEKMLAHEYGLLAERLGESRGATSRFFVFANTVAARSYRGNNDSHGWLGIRFQCEPNSQPNDIIVHVRMLDKENILQQQALGIIGVNLVFGAVYLREDPSELIASLLDELTPERIEVDMIEINGPDFAHLDNRILSLDLVRHKLTNAVMFAPQKKILQPSEALYKKAVLVERGSFRPVTNVNVDMLRSAEKMFRSEPDVEGKEVVTLLEITMNNLLGQGQLDMEDFIARADTISNLGYTVLITDYPEFYKLPAFFRRYTTEKVGIVVGLNSLLLIFDEQYYHGLEGGILEACGKLFHNKIRFYVYPMTRTGVTRYLSEHVHLASPDSKKDGLITADDLEFSPQLDHLYRYLIDSKNIVSIKEFDRKCLDVLSSSALDKIRSGDATWESMVPQAVVDLIKSRRLFGHKQ